MLLSVYTLRATMYFDSLDSVVEGLKTNVYTDIEKELIAKEATKLLKTSGLDHDMIEYYKNIFDSYSIPITH